MWKAWGAFNALWSLPRTALPPVSPQRPEAPRGVPQLHPSPEDLPHRRVGHGSVSCACGKVHHVFQRRQRRVPLLAQLSGGVPILSKGLPGKQALQGPPPSGTGVYGRGDRRRPAQRPAARNAAGSRPEARVPGPRGILLRCPRAEFRGPAYSSKDADHARHNFVVRMITKGKIQGDAVESSQPGQ